MRSRFRQQTVIRNLDIFIGVYLKQGDEQLYCMLYLNKCPKTALCFLPDEVQRLVFVPDSPAGPALIQEMPVVLGAVRLNWVSALVTSLMRQREGNSSLQEEFYTLTMCESLRLFSTTKHLLTS